MWGTGPLVLCRARQLCRRAGEDHHGLAAGVGARGSVVLRSVVMEPVQKDRDRRGVEEGAARGDSGAAPCLREASSGRRCGSGPLRSSMPS